MPGLKAHTIKVLLRKKIREWLSTVENEEFRQELERNVIVTGGCITSFLLGEKPNDYDFYLRDLRTTYRAAVYYATQFNKSKSLKAAAGVVPYKVLVKVVPVVNIKNITEQRVIFYMKSAGVASETQEEYRYFESSSEGETLEFTDSLGDSLTEIAHQDLEQNPEVAIENIEDELKELKKENKKYRPVFLTDNAVSLSNKVQLIVRFYGDPDALHRNFDFVHATCSYDYWNDKLVLPPESLEAILSKTLIYTGSLYPIASIFRTRKFLNRGWRISAGQLLKIIWQINELNMGDPRILREQLIGVDMAYMTQLISALQNIEPGKKIDGTYVANLIDQIFDE
jgi:hypothetical protein